MKYYFLYSQNISQKSLKRDNHNPYIEEEQTTQWCELIKIARPLHFLLKCLYQAMKAVDHVYVCQGSCICVLGVMCICVRSHVYVCQGSCICVRGHVYVCQGSCICVLGVMHMCVRGHAYVCQGSSICVLGVMYMCVRGHVYVCNGYRFCLCFYDFSIGFRNFPTALYFLKKY